MRRPSLVLGFTSIVATGCPDDDTSVTSATSSEGDTTTDASTTISPTPPVTSGVPTGTADGSTTDPDGTTTDLDGTTTSPDSSTTGPACGDDVMEGDEVCDGSDLDDQTCESQGFAGGMLTCMANCTGFDVRGCVDPVCADGVQQGMEQCDGEDLGGATCISVGFDSGTLTCAVDCTLDTAGCGTCGNVIIDGNELCDDVVLLGETCESQGFDSGDLACAADCASFETAGCGTCGNALIDGAEECDGMDLAGQTCLSLGLDDGVLECSASCQFNASDCSDARLFLSEDANANGLYELSIVDGSIMNVGISGVTASTCGLAFNSNTGNLLGSQPGDLLEIQVDGSGSVALGAFLVEGMAYDPASNTLYAAINGNFFTVDPATGATLSNLAAPGFDMEGLAFDSNTGVVYGIGDSTLLSVYDPAMDIWSVVGDTGLDWDSGGLAFDPGANTLYAVATAQGAGLYTIDPVTAVPMLVGNNGLGLTLRGGLAMVL